MAFNFSDRFMLYTFGHNIEFAFVQGNYTITEVNIQFAFNNEKQFIRFRMVMPDEFSLNFCQLDMIIVHLRKYLWRPVLGEFR